MSRLNSKDFGQSIYNRFPPKYQVDDLGQKLALKRFIESINEGGFKYIIDEQNGILDLVDFKTAPLPVLFLLYKQYGFELFNGIPEEFIRAFLPNLGYVLSKKGSLDVVEQIVSSLTGIKVETEVIYNKDNSLYLKVLLIMDYENSRKWFPNLKNFSRILERLLPFYCDTNMTFHYTFNDLPEIITTDKYDFYNIIKKETETGIIHSAAGILEVVALIQEEVGLLLPKDNSNSDVIFKKLEEKIFVEGCESIYSSDVSINTQERTLIEDSDYFYTYLKEKNLIEEGIIDNNYTSYASLLNTKGELNSTFKLNGFNGWDTFIKDDSKEVMFY